MTSAGRAQRGRNGASCSVRSPDLAASTSCTDTWRILLECGRRFPGARSRPRRSSAATAENSLALPILATDRSCAAVAIACRLATRVHVTTRFMSDQAKARGIDAVGIPLGVDADRMTRGRPPDEGPPWRLLQIANLNRVKDQSTLLKALRIARERIDARVDLVGEDTLAGTIQREAADLGLADAVSFHGWLPHDALVRFHNAAHLYVQSSRHEGGGVSVLEACVAGVPVVGTAVGYVSDLAPRSAIAVPPNDPPALAAAIVRLLQHPAERRSIADSAYEFTSSHDADWTAKRLVALYKSLSDQASAHDASESEQTQR